MTSRPLAVPGWTPTPLIVSLSWYAENDSVSISPRPEPSNVYATSAPNASRSKWSVPLPISSSTVKAIRAVARGASSRTSWATAVMIAATPALSSAPSSVVPSLVTRSCPTLVGERGHLRGVEDLGRVARKVDRLARPRAVDDRPDARPRRVGRGVDVRDQPDRRGVGHRPGQRREDVARLGQLGVLETERVELGDQEAREVELLLGGRVRRGVDGRLGVDRDVAEEPLEQLLAERLGERPRVAWISQASRAGGAARPSSSVRRAARRRGSARSASGAASSVA